MKIAKKITRFLFIFAVITSWVFSGWPQIRFDGEFSGERFSVAFPPKVQEAKAAVTFQRAGSSTGTSLTIDIGAAGNDRLVVVVLGDESTPGDIFQGTVSVDGKTFTQAAVADNPDGAGNHLEVHTIDEATLGSSNGSLSITYSGGAASWAIRVAVYYGVKDDTLIDSEKEDIAVGSAVDVENVSSNNNSLVFFAAGNGSSGGTSGWTSPLTERIDGATNPPSSAVLGIADGIETTGQTNKTYSVTIGTNLRSTGIVVVFDEATAGPATPTLDDDPTFSNIASTSTPFLGYFNAVDAEGDAVEYEINWDTDSNFTAPVLASESSSEFTSNGFSAATFSSGASVSYGVLASESFSNGQTYWWRVRARDPAGSNTWSSYSTASRSITIDTSLTQTAWLQTTRAQFNTDTLSSTVASVSNSIALLGGSGGTTSFSAANATGGSLSTTVNIGTAGTNRLVAVFAGSETDSAIALTGVTVDSKACSLVQAALNTDSLGNRTELWYCDEDDLGSSNSSVTVAITGSGITAVNWAVHAIVYTGVSQAGPNDSGKDETSISPTTTTSVVGIDTSVNGVVVMGAHNGAGALAVSSYTSPLTERTAADPASADGVSASGVESSIQTNKTYTITWASAPNRSSGVVASWNPASTTSGSAISSLVDFDWVSGVASWSEVIWNVTEPSGSPSSSVSMQVFYTSSTTCDTLVPDNLITNNSIGIASTSSPLDISGVASSSYNQLCLKATLHKGGASTSPTLDDWKVTWAPLVLAESTYNQSGYRWYQNQTSTFPASEVAGQNQSGIFPGASGWMRLRMLVHVGTSTLSQSGQSFELQYAGKGAGNCAAPSGTPSSYTDITGATLIAYTDTSGINDGDAITGGWSLDPIHGSHTVVAQTYEESNNFTNSTAEIPSGQDGLWDFSLKDNGGTSGEYYCIRAVKVDNTAFGSYDAYAQVQIEPNPNIKRYVGESIAESLSGGGTVNYGGSITVQESEAEGGGSGGGEEQGGGEEPAGGGGASPILLYLFFVVPFALPLYGYINVPE